MEAELFHGDGPTDTHEKRQQPLLRNFAKAPKNELKFRIKS